MRISLLLAVLLCSTLLHGQDILWANSIGGRFFDTPHKMYTKSNGYILPVQFRGVIQVGSQNFGKKNIEWEALVHISKDGLIRRLDSIPFLDSMQINYYGDTIDQSFLVYGIQGYDKVKFNNEIYQYQKISYAGIVDTQGNFKLLLTVKCKKNNNFIKTEGAFPYSLHRCRNLTLGFANLANTNSTYYFNDDSIVLASKKLSVLFELKDDGTVKVINTFEFGCSLQKTYDQKLFLIYNLGENIGQVEFTGKTYYYEKYNCIFLMQLDDNFNPVNVLRVPGTYTSINNVIAGHNVLFLTCDLVVAEDRTKFKLEHDSISLARGGYSIIHCVSSGKIKYSKIFLKVEGSKLFQSVQALSLITNEGISAIALGQIVDPALILPDSVVIPAKKNNGDFFTMKLDTFGNVLWQYNLGSYSTQEYAKTAIIEDDGVVVSGTFDSTTTLGNYTLTSNGGTDALLFKITDNSIYRGNIKKGPYCAGDSIEVPYRAYGKYADTNTFFAELSDENGNFYGTPRQLGSLKTNALQGTIRGVLPLFDVVSSGKYRIRIRSNSPFVQSFMRYDSLYLLIYSKDKANPGADTTICLGDTLQLKTTGGTRWHWSPGTAVTDSTARVTQFVGKQNTRLRIAISDSSGCGAPDTAWKYIALYPKLAVTARDTVVCRNTSFHITATVEGGRPSSRSVQWYAGTTYLGKDTLKSSTWFDTSFMAVATDGCASNTDTTRVRVSLPNPPSLSINDTTVCAGSLLLWQPTITGYKDRPVQLSWYRGTTKLSNSLLQLQVDSNQVLWLHGDDYCAAAENRKEVHIEVFEKPTVSVVIDSICAEVGHTVMFAAAGGKGPYTYWLNDQQVSKSAYTLVQPSQWLRWYAQDACQQKTVLDSVLVHQQPRGQIMAAPENGCAPLMVSLRSNQTNTTWYIENKSIQGQDTLPYGFTKAGVYTVKMVVENGECKDSGSKQIEVYEAPKAWFEIQQRDLLIGEARTRVINTSGPAKRYIWYWKDSMRESSSLDAWALHLQDTGMSKVWMIAENIHGCRDTFTDTVYVHPQPILWIPTAITLNGDGLNDALAAGGIGLKSYRFMVFNRWGEMVFSGKENEEWRPSSTVLPGMYVYRCIYSNWKGTKFEQNGTVMLLR